LTAQRRRMCSATWPALHGAAGAFLYVSLCPPPLGSQFDKRQIGRD
jgi:hypothetical protein